MSGVAWLNKGYGSMVSSHIEKIHFVILYRCFYNFRRKITSLLGDIRKDVVVMMLYFVPAFLYCLYNNLIFVNLSTFDPTSYYLLLQFRVVVTGILFQVIIAFYNVNSLNLIINTFNIVDNI